MSEARPGRLGSGSRRSADLVTVLIEAQRRGLTGPGAVTAMVDHARGFAHGLDAPHRFLDLGSGGGLPGLVLTDVWPDAEVVLLDGSRRRTDFLVWAVQQLGYGRRVTTVVQRAEEAGREPELRSTFDLVVARGFGPPPVTAECAAPFLRVGGRLVVSEPPEQPSTGPAGGQPSEGGGPTRWPDEGLALLGLAPGREWRAPYRYQELVAVAPCPDRFPRRVGVPAKRPLF